MAIPQHIMDVLQKRLAQHPLTDQERTDLDQWYRSESDQNRFLGEANWEEDLFAYLKVNADQQKKDQEFEKFMAAVGSFVASSSAEAQMPRRSVHRLHFLRKWSWAAAIILLLGTGGYLYTALKRTEQSSVSNDKPLQKDIEPGINKALLTVDDKRIDLASDKTGITVGETIAYTDGEKLSDAGKSLMLMTPNGGQYQLVLPDGTKAWLNAASSISFPSAFTGDSRKVKITGEVYLEVAKDKVHPFLVDVAGWSTVEVLGTHFNVNSYADENDFKITLLEGSVRVGAAHDVFGNNRVLLKPGQQAVIPVAAEIAKTGADASLAAGQKNGNAGDITINSTADLNQIVAWKNGLFNFNNSDLRSAMKQLERWYDIEVRYEGEIPRVTLDGEMYRNVNLSDVLEPLSKMGLKFRRDGKILIVGN